ncbi:MAG TPA: hypothetical protein VIG76_06530 [Amnibacterium sp.]|jgi:hypothetical protein|uniref:hypothetical protein n=1 Tax=Amnibacterium sp. TaxID=1872496 RepID=UPI002F93E50E
MPWLALALCLWGLFLGVTDGPAAGAAVMAAGVALLVLRGAVDARRARRSRQALLAATTAARPAPRPTAAPAAPTTTVLRRPAFRAPDAIDEALLQAFWNFGSVTDAAALAGCEPLEAQRRLVELVLEPGARVAVPAMPDRALTDFEERAVVRGWNAGEPLASLSAAFGVSVFALGGLLLAAGPIPVGARA